MIVEIVLRDNNNKEMAQGFQEAVIEISPKVFIFYS